VARFMAAALPFVNRQKLIIQRRNSRPDPRQLPGGNPKKHTTHPTYSPKKPPAHTQLYSPVKPTPHKHPQQTYTKDYIIHLISPFSTRNPFYFSLPPLQPSRFPPPAPQKDTKKTSPPLSSSHQLPTTKSHPPPHTNRYHPNNSFHSPPHPVSKKPKTQKQNCTTKHKKNTQTQIKPPSPPNKKNKAHNPNNPPNTSF